MLLYTMQVAFRQRNKPSNRIHVQNSLCFSFLWFVTYLFLAVQKGKSICSPPNCPVPDCTSKKYKDLVIPEGKCCPVCKGNWFSCLQGERLLIEMNTCFKFNAKYRSICVECSLLFLGLVEKVDIRDRVGQSPSTFNPNQE